LKGRAVAHGAVSIVNAISIGKGAALGISLTTEAKVSLDHTRGKGSIQFEGDAAEDHILAEATVRETLQCYAVEPFDTIVKTESQIPAGKGLKSSSVASNAITLAMVAALGKDIDDIQIINTGVNASLKAGVTITGAFDDACASYFGGFIVTDNEKRRILRQESASPDLIILIYIPEEQMYTKDFDKSKLIPFRAMVSEAFALALRGEYWNAMTINGRIHSTALSLTPRPAQTAIYAGALAAGLSGTGPAVAAVCSRETVENVKEGWLDLPGNVMETVVNNSVAEVIE
jgi:shikimate kinase